MKNLIVNIFKTLFFFDAGVIAFTLLPAVKKFNPALNKLISEFSVLGIVLIFTLVFLLLVEKRRLKLHFGKKRFRAFLTGLSTGAVIPITYIAVLAVFKNINIIGFNKTEHSYYWILALLCNAVAMELFFRGYLFTLYKKFYGFTFATVITTALYLSFNFKIFSMSKTYIAIIILFNVLLCFLLEYSNSLITVITARFTYTLLSTYALGSLPLTTGYPALLKRTFADKLFFAGKDIPLEGSRILLIALAFITLVFIAKKYHPVKQFKRLAVLMKNIPLRIRTKKRVKP